MFLWCKFAMVRKIIASTISICALIGYFYFPSLFMRNLLLGVALWLIFLPENKSIYMYKLEYLNYVQLQKDISAQKSSVFSGLSLVVKMYALPIFLVLYLWYLIIEQTHIANLHLSRFFLSLHEWVLVLFIAVTGLLSVTVSDDLMGKYVVLVSSRFLWWVYVFFTGMCSLLTIWVIAEKTTSLWWKSQLLSVLGWGLLILLGNLLLEGERNEEIVI